MMIERLYFFTTAKIQDFRLIMDLMSKSFQYVITLTSCLVILSDGYTRKVSRYNFERGVCPFKCRLDPNTQACMQAQWLTDEELNVHNICTRYLQERFDSDSDCTTKCDICDPQRMISKCTKDVLDKRFSLCNLKPEHGPCEEKFIMWHYNIDAGACTEFHYGGCGGNRNRFSTELECLLRCGLLGLANVTQNQIMLRNMVMEHNEL